jgi:hypothetical protein
MWHRGGVGLGVVCWGLGVRIGPGALVGDMFGLGGCAPVVGCHRVCFCDGSSGEGYGYWWFCLCCGVLVMMALLEDRVAVAMGAVRVWGVTAGLWLFDDVCCRLAGWCDQALLLWVARRRGRRQVRLRGQGETAIATSTADLVRGVRQF